MIVADDISHRITRDLLKCIKPDDVNSLRLGLREIIVNAIEHGNLEITYEDKTNALIFETYRELLHERRLSRQNKNKKVSISYSFHEDRVRYIIKDCGSGFDFKKMMQQDGDSINRQLLQHGRGILIAKTVFDEILYNETGNEVTLIKNLKKEE